MALLTVQNIVFNGAGDITLVSADVAGDTFANDGNTRYLLFNGDASQTTATIVTPKTLRGLTVQDPPVTIEASGTALIGPFDPNLFNDTAGIVSVTYSSITSLTVAAVKG